MDPQELARRSAVDHFLRNSTRVVTKNTPGEIWIFITHPGEFALWQLRKRAVEARSKAFFAGSPGCYSWPNPYVYLIFNINVKEETLEIPYVATGSGRCHIGRFAIDLAPGRLTLTRGQHKLTFVVASEDYLPGLLIPERYSNIAVTSTVDNQHLKDAEKYRVILSPEMVAMGDKHAIWEEIYRQLAGYVLAEVKPEAHRVLPSGGHLFDFGGEIYGFPEVRLKGGQDGYVTISAGESIEEALDLKNREQPVDHVMVCDKWRPNLPRVFRYLYIKPDNGQELESVVATEEIYDVTYRGFFESSDPLLNKIWYHSAYTLRSCMRDFYLDGCKRDALPWMGDARQSILTNFYVFGDTTLAKRTLTALRGRGKPQSHINSIVDYSLYWILSLKDYYAYSGDKDYIRANLDELESMLEFLFELTDGFGFLRVKAADWLFIDWADFTMGGKLSSLQILYYWALEGAGELLKTCGQVTKAEEVLGKVAELKRAIFEHFWCEEASCFADKPESAKDDLRYIIRHPNIFAICSGLVDAGLARKIAQRILLNGKIEPIVTPYMQFYQLDALLNVGEVSKVMEHIRMYWGGQLELGATTFWEAYDPQKSGTEHYVFYGRPYGLSLCHAWGASPLYLLSSGVLGVRFWGQHAEVVIEPHLGELEWVRGSVPTPYGNLTLNISQYELSGRLPQGLHGKVLWGSNIYEVRGDFHLVNHDFAGV